MWEGRPYDLDDEDSITKRRRLAVEVDRMREDYEGRVFEDPLYLMQYTLDWKAMNVGEALHMPENDAFLSVESDAYLMKVGTYVL